MSDCLADVKDGSVTVRSFHGGDGLQSHLAGMGIIAGMKVDVLRNDGRGPIVIKVHSTRIAIGRMMAKKIFVGT